MRREEGVEAINEAFSGVCFEMAQFDSIFTRAKHIMSTRPEKTVTVWKFHLVHDSLAFLYYFNKTLKSLFFYRFVFWYLGGKMIYNNRSMGTIITNHTDRSTKATQSSLTITNANPKLHSGNYTCKPSNAREASIQLFVSEGKEKFCPLSFVIYSWSHLKNFFDE